MSIREGLRTVSSDRDARLVVGLLTARTLMIGAADVLFVLLALDLLGIGEPGAGLLSGALGAGAIVGGATTFRLIGRSRLASVAAAGAIAWGVAMAGIAITGSAWLAPLLVVIGGAGLAVVDIAGRTMLQRSIRDEVLARVFGLQEGLAMAGLAAGSIIVPILVALFGLVGAVLVTAAILPRSSACGGAGSPTSIAARSCRSGRSPCFVAARCFGPCRRPSSRPSPGARPG